MKKILIVVVLGVALGAVAPSAWQIYQGWRAERVARERLERMLRSMDEDDAQQAISAWAKNMIVMSYEELEEEQPRFEAFWSRSGLGTRSGWTVASLEADGADNLVYADVTAGGEHVWLLVHPDRPIEIDRGD